MPVTAYARQSGPRPAKARSTVLIGLINNMPDTALQATENQFASLLVAAAGGHEVLVANASLSGLPRGDAARKHIEANYWTIDQLLRQRPEALIVTGTEPRAPDLTDEPYWSQLSALIDWADANTVSSIWSCLAAHAVTQRFDGVRRRRLPEKCCGVYTCSIEPGTWLGLGLGNSLPTPHSRWNDLPGDQLAAKGYAIFSQSTAGGVNIFIRKARSIFLGLQGHPEYDDRALLKEYQRDVGRFLSGEHAGYPTVPHGYFSAESTALLEEYRARAIAAPRSEMLQDFPYMACAATLSNTWTAGAIHLYRNWLEFIRLDK